MERIRHIEQIRSEELSSGSEERRVGSVWKGQVAHARRLDRTRRRSWDSRVVFPVRVAIWNVWRRERRGFVFVYQSSRGSVRTELSEIEAVGEAFSLKRL